MTNPEENNNCHELHQEILAQRDLIIVSNRGPFTFQTSEEGEVKMQRGGGGLVTALLGLANQVPSTWIASAASEEDRAWKEGDVLMDDPGSAQAQHDSRGRSIHIRFIDPDAEAYERYYGVIANPLLWFLQHSIWSFSQSPTINRDTWLAWETGYVHVNWLFAEAVTEQVRRSQRPCLVMLQDYHLYLAPLFIRQLLRSSPDKRRSTILTHFIHIPWPGPEDWGLLPGRMRETILQGLCAVDLVGFQTREDALNFIRTCESLLPGVRVNYRRGQVIYHSHTTHVRDFPISIDVEGLREIARTDEVQQFQQQIAEGFDSRKMILRIDRTEPSKNIVRGFQAYEEMLEKYPEHQGKVQFLTLLSPSRLKVEEYQDYLSAIMSAAGMVNAKYGTSDWEPVRVLVSESYPRALAAMTLYDVLMVNPVADGMNLVAKEGPTLNEKAGVIVLSERAGATQQLGREALVIAPVDVSATAEALHQALAMPEPERQRRAGALKRAVEREDIYLWLCWQLDALQELLGVNQEMRKHEAH